MDNFPCQTFEDTWCKFYYEETFSLALIDFLFFASNKLKIFSSLSSSIPIPVSSTSTTHPRVDFSTHINLRFSEFRLELGVFCLNLIENFLSNKDIEFVVLPRPNPRQEHRLIVCFEGEADALAVKKYNQICPSLEKISEVFSVEKFPRTLLGKVRRNALLKRFNDKR